MDDDLPRVSGSMLRRADRMCRRRLKHEHTADKRNANKTADVRFAVANRLTEDARLAHTGGGRPDPKAFVPPRELGPEQQALYRAAVTGYLAAFGDRPCRLTDLGMHMALPEHGVSLWGSPGLAVDDGHTRELRVLQLGGRRKLLDEIDVHLALVRTANWAGDQLRIVAYDLIEQTSTVVTPQLPGARVEAFAWLADRIEVVKRNAADGRARAGADCNGCPYVAGCEKHT